MGRQRWIFRKSSPGTLRKLESTAARSDRTKHYAIDAALCSSNNSSRGGCYPGYSRFFQLHTGGSSRPGDLTVFNDELYFGADGSTTGRALWKVNAAGAVTLVVDVNDFQGCGDPKFSSI